MGSVNQISQEVNGGLIRTNIMYFNNVIFAVLFMKSILADSTLDVFQSVDEFSTLPSGDSRTTYKTTTKHSDGSERVDTESTTEPTLVSTTESLEKTRTSSDVAATTSSLFTTQTTNLPSTSRVETTSVADNDFTTQNQDDMTEETTESSMITSTYKTTPTDT